MRKCCKSFDAPTRFFFPTAIAFLVLISTGMLDRAAAAGFPVDFSGIYRSYAQPNSLMRADDGNFYGTTFYGPGSGQGYGTVFRITSTGVLTVLHSFRGSDGMRPV